MYVINIIGEGVAQYYIYATEHWYAEKQQTWMVLLEGWHIVGTHTRKVDVVPSLWLGLETHPHCHHGAFQPQLVQLGVEPHLWKTTSGPRGLNCGLRALASKQYVQGRAKYPKCNDGTASATQSERLECTVYTSLHVLSPSKAHCGMETDTASSPGMME
jgi:hypothetical protein